MRRTILVTVAVVAVGALAGTARATAFTGIYAFGDSLSDVGNLYTYSGGIAPAAPYSNGRFTNGNVWVQDVASSLGLGAVTPSRTGGSDYAWGGAETGPIGGVTPASVPSLLDQFTSFSGAVGGSAPSGALYTVSIGANDVNAILGAGFSTLAEITTAIGQAVTNELTFLSELEGIGAKNVLLLNVPNLGKTPDATALGSGAVAAASAAAGAYDTVLATGLASLPGLDVHVIDSYSLLDAAVANPAAYGFTNVTDPCWTGTYFGYAGPGGALCASTVAAQGPVPVLGRDPPHGGGPPRARRCRAGAGAGAGEPVAAGPAAGGAGADAAARGLGGTRGTQRKSPQTFTPGTMALGVLVEYGGRHMRRRRGLAGAARAGWPRT